MFQLFGTEFFIAFGIGMLISGSATALYYGKEHIKRVLGISDWLIMDSTTTIHTEKHGLLDKQIVRNCIIIVKNLPIITK